MTNQFRVSSTLPGRLQELGLLPEGVLRRAGLPIGLFSQERILVSTEELFALHQGIADASDDPGFGLKLGALERVEHYDPTKIIALAARSFRDAVQRLAHYKQLTCPEEIRSVDRGNECAVQFIWLLAHEEEPPLLVDVCFAWIVALAQRGTAQPLHPKRVEFQRAPRHREIYEAYFRCPIKFNSDQNALVFSKTDMELPFVTHNADLLAVVEPQLSTRTLQRRLSEERITFQRLLDDARRELARHYLLHSSRELNETAYLLGYEDANSFFRAFHHWEGTSPAQWREFQKNSQPATQTHLATPATRRRASLGLHRTIKGGGL